MKILAVMVLSLSLLACGTGPCHEQKNHTPTSEVNVNASRPTDRVKVYKPDGSKQCGQGQAIAPETMKKELGDIQVFSMKKQADGLMHIQMCGTPTGQCNVYEIPRIDLDKAKSAGFKEWAWD